MLNLHPVDCDLNALQRGEMASIQLDGSSRISPGTSIPARQRTALVIGANGFVGAHVVQALCTDTRVERVICLVRPRHAISPAQRVLTTIEHYNLCLPASAQEKCEFVTGHCTREKFGLTNEEYERLSDEVDTVYHVAGATDYETSYEELREEYVVSLLGVLSFCSQRRAKQLHYLSSTIRLMFQSPADFEKHSWWYSGYGRMKWVNSVILARAREQFGLQTAVYEAPYIVGSSSLGQDPGLAYSFWRAAVACVQLRQLWDGGFMQFVPVDLVCQAMLINTTDRRSMRSCVTPTIDTLDNRDIADELGCQLIAPDAFFDHAQHAVAPARRRMFAGVQYSDIVKASCPNGMAEIMDPTELPSAADVFRRGLGQPSIQAALKKTH